MEILITHECSGIIRDQFNLHGHNAYSNDIKPCEKGNITNHLLMDCVDAIMLRHWDIIIMHPVCTKLCVSGNHVYAKGKPKYHERLRQVEYTQQLWDLAISRCDHVCMENPVGVLNTMGVFPKPQYVQPYNFGHDASKKTGLWLYGLPKLKPTEYIQPRVVNGKLRWSNQTDSGQNRLGPSDHRAADRARTYIGIARAMAEQWTKCKIDSLAIPRQLWLLVASPCGGEGLLNQKN